MIMRRFVPHRFVDDQWTCLTCGETHPDPCDCPCCASGKLVPEEPTWPALEWPEGWEPPVDLDEDHSAS